MHVFVCGQAQPTFNLQYAFGDSTIAVGAATNITWTIETSEGGYYSPMSAEVIMPFIENAPALRLCRAEVTRVGKNIPCFDIDGANARTNLTSRCVRDVRTMASLVHVHVRSMVLCEF